MGRPGAAAFCESGKVLNQHVNHDGEAWDAERPSMLLRTVVVAVVVADVVMPVVFVLVDLVIG